MKAIKKTTLCLFVLGLCGQLNAGASEVRFSGSGCVINDSALADYNSESQYVINIPLDSAQQGINEKVIHVPPLCQDCCHP